MYIFAYILLHSEYTFSHPSPNTNYVLNIIYILSMKEEKKTEIIYKCTKLLRTRDRVPPNMILFIKLEP